MKAAAAAVKAELIKTHIQAKYTVEELKKRDNRNDMARGGPTSICKCVHSSLHGLRQTSHLGIPFCSAFLLIAFEDRLE